MWLLFWGAMALWGLDGGIFGSMISNKYYRCRQNFVETDAASKLKLKSESLTDTDSAKKAKSGYRFTQNG